MFEKPTRQSSLDLLHDCISLAPLEKPITEDVSFLGYEFIVTHTNERRYRLERDISSACIKQKTALLYNRDMLFVAFIHASSLRLNGANPVDFMESCDAYSQEITDLANILDKHWILGNIKPRSDILYLNRLCIHPDYACKGIAKELTLWTLHQLAPKPIITILKAFPLQFEGVGDHDDNDEFISLKNGLMDYYSRTLGLAALPSSFGRKGWMSKSTMPMDDWCDVL